MTFDVSRRRQVRLAATALVTAAAVGGGAASALALAPVPVNGRMCPLSEATSVTAVMPSCIAPPRLCLLPAVTASMLTEWCVTLPAPRWPPFGGGPVVMAES